MKKVWVFLGKVLISTAFAVGMSFYIKNIILKLAVFSAVYLVLWGYSLYKKKLEVF